MGVRPARQYNSLVASPVQRFLQFLLALGLVHTLFLLGQEGVRAWRLGEERARLEAALRAREARVAALRTEVGLAQDPLYLEALLRRKGWVHREEELHAAKPR